MKSMKAVVLDRVTKANDIILSDVPIPEVRQGWVLIKVKAFGMNHSEKILRLNEIEADYIEDLRNDCQKQSEIFINNLGYSPIALSYPSGKHDTLSDVILKEEGIKISFTINEGNNTIIKGLPQSLIALNRYNMEERTNMDRMLELFNS